jgi:hypothetical protein
MGSWERRNNELLTSLSDYLAQISGANDTPVIVASGNVASAAAVATIPPSAGYLTHLVGFRVSGLGATAGLAVIVTVTGVADDSLEFSYVAKAGVLLANEELEVIFPFPIAAADDDTDIVITCPDLGDGNTHNQVVAYGLYRVSDLLAENDTAAVDTSGNVANAVAAATIPAIAGKIAHLTGLRVEGLGATAGSTKTATVTGVADDALAYPVVVVAGVAVANALVSKRFPVGLPAPDDETDIVVSCPALGAGNTHNLVTIFGFYRPA